MDKYAVGDIVKLKKKHPCGSFEWEVLRVGADFRLKCLGCGHQIMIARKLVEKNVKDGLVKDEDLKEETLKKYGNTKNLLQYLKDNRFEEELCFSHGDTSLPNIFSLNCKFSGFIDVGECGIADKWFDLAICEKSIRRNLGEKYVSKFYEELNIIPDRKKSDYYLLMMELYI